MADVPLYVALITAGASVIAGSVPLVVGWARDTGHEKRALAEARRLEQSEIVRKKRERCVLLLRLAHDFRVLVENTYDGDRSDTATGAAQVLQSVAGLASQADEVEFMVPGVETEVIAFAAAVSGLVSAAAAWHREHGGGSLPPEVFLEFDQCLESFKKAARKTFDGLPEPLN
jgi:hypothetical protein